MEGPSARQFGLPVLGESFFSSASLPPPAHAVDKRQSTKKMELGRPGSFRTLFSSNHSEEVAHLEPILAKVRPTSVGKSHQFSGVPGEDTKMRMHTAKLQPTHKAKQLGRRARDQRPNSSQENKDKPGQRAHSISQLADSVGGSRHQREALARLASRKAIKYDLSLANDPEREKKLLLDDYKRVISNIRIIMKNQPNKSAPTLSSETVSPMESFLSAPGGSTKDEVASPPPIKRHDRASLKSSGGTRPNNSLRPNQTRTPEPSRPSTRGSSVGMSDGRPLTPTGDDMPLREFRLSSRGGSEGASQRSSMNEEDVDEIDTRLPQVGVGVSTKQDDAGGQSQTAGLASGRLEPLSVSTYRSVGSNLSNEKEVCSPEGSREDILESPPTSPLEAPRSNSLIDPSTSLEAFGAGETNSQGQADSQLNVFNMLMGRRNTEVLPALGARTVNDLGWENDFVEMAEDDDIEVFLRNQMNPEPPVQRTTVSSSGKKPRKRKDVESVKRERALRDKPR